MAQDQLIDTETRRTILAAMLIVIGAGGLGWAAWIGVSAIRLGLGGAVETDGAVTDCRMELGRFSHGSVVTVRFRPASEEAGEVSTHSDLRSCSQASAAHYRVRYQPGSPGLAMTTQDYETAPERALLLAILCAFFVSLGLMILRLGAHHRLEANDTLRDVGGTP
jgi:hypothetical protein